MKKRKTLLAAIAVALVAILCLGGTLAYFTDVSGERLNKFDIADGGDNNVYFDTVLKEDKWVEGAKHTIAPGKNFEKDPTIELTDDVYAEGAYVAFVVEVKNTGDLTAEQVKALFYKSGKTVDLGLVYDAATETYKATIYVDEKLTLEAPTAVLFTDVKFPESLTEEQIKSLEGFEIDVAGYAIAGVGFNNDAAAAKAELKTFVEAQLAA